MLSSICANIPSTCSVKYRKLVRAFRLKTCRNTSSFQRQDKHGSLLGELHQFGILALRPTFATPQLSTVHCLNLQCASDCFIERFWIRFLEFHPYFPIVHDQRIDKLVLSKTTLQIRLCLRIGSADESSQLTGEIWQLLGPPAMPGTESRGIQFLA